MSPDLHQSGDGLSRFQRDRRERLVICDASWDPGSRIATLAVVGALGTHHKHIECGGNAVAEAECVLWAMQLALGQADGRKPPRLVFRTDAQGVVIARRLSGDVGEVVNKIRRYLARFRQWDLEWARRRSTGPANTHARAKRRRADA